MGSNLSLWGRGEGGLGVLPQENVEIWSALGAILGLKFSSFYDIFLKKIDSFNIS